MYMSSSPKGEDVWAQLVPTEGVQKEAVLLIGDNFSIGRKTDVVDYAISNNKHVSGCHCVFKRINLGYKKILEDTSTNGTLLNGKRLKKNIEVELHHDDVITIVQRKDDPGLNVVYRFQDFRNVEDSESTLPYVADEGDSGGVADEILEGDSGREEGHPLEEVDGGDGLVKGSRKRLLSSDDESDNEFRIPRSKMTPSESEQASISISTPQKPSLTKMDSIEETLICQICQEILHDCVSLQPCMHSYCAGCYSDWMTQSSSCPACRDEVIRVSKNHIVNNLVAAYLRSNPDKKRPPEDLKELDEKNKITQDGLYPKKAASSFYTDFSSSGSDSSSYSEEERIQSCRQCPHYNITSMGSLPLDQLPHPYTCTSSTLHVTCACCSNMMPLRLEPSISAVQRCKLCLRYFCHQYWTCQGLDCCGLGCIGPFKDLKLKASYYNGIVGNAYESNIFKCYFESQGLTIQDFFQAACEKLENGEYQAIFDGRLSTTTTTTCHDCALHYIKELAYLYRKDIPISTLPSDVTRRTDCYWGRDCRTQFTNPAHAKKFNHVCEKTRFS